MAETTVGVVVPCRNERHTLGACLAAIRAQTHPVRRVVVVDNGSTDGSPAIARQHADLVLTGIGTVAALRNAGAAALPDVDVLAFVDADVVLDPTWTERALRALDRADLVGARSLAPADASWVARRWADIESRTARATSSAWSQHLALRAETFAAIGGFDAQLRTGEDADLSRRVRQAGAAVALDDRLVAVHHGFPTTLAAFVRRERWHAGTPGWFRAMSPLSRALVLAAGAWAAAGLGAVVAGAALGPMPPTVWLLATAAAVPVLGRASGADRTHSVADGVLLATWAGTRATRLRHAFGAGSP